MLVVTVPKQKISHAIEIIIEDHGGDVQCLDGMKGRLHVLKKFLEAAGRPAEPMYIFEPVVEASLTGRRMSYDPSLAVELASGFDAKFKNALEIIRQRAAGQEQWAAYLEWLESVLAE